MILLNESINYLEDLKIYKFPEQTSVVEASYIAMIENEKHWNSLIQETAIEELREAASTITGTVFNEADNGEKTSIFDKIAEGFKKFLAMIGGLFAKTIEWIKNCTISNKKLFDSKDVILKGFDSMTDEQKKLKGYAYGDLVKLEIGRSDALNSIKSMFTELEGVVTDKKNDKYKEYLDTKNIESRKKRIRGVILDKGFLTQEEFDKEAQKLISDYRDKVLTKEFVSKCFETLKYSDKEAKNALKKEFADCKNSINKYIAELENLRKNLSSDDEHIQEKKKCIAVFSSECKLFIGCTQKLYSLKLKSFITTINQCTAVLKKCYAAGIKGSKDTTTTESTIIGNGLFYVNLI